MSDNMIFLDCLQIFILLEYFKKYPYNYILCDFPITNISNV